MQLILVIIFVNLYLIYFLYIILVKNYQRVMNINLIHQYRQYVYIMVNYLMLLDMLTTTLMIMVITNQKII